MKYLLITILLIPFLAQAQTISQSVLVLTNNERQAPLQLSPLLSEKAQIRAEYLCGHPFSHDNWKASFANTKFGYIGENLAKDFANTKDMNKALMASPTHKANIENPHYKLLGVGNACGVVVELFAD